MSAARDPGELGDSEARQRSANELGKRVISALVLGMVAIAAAVIGGLPFLLLWTAAAFLVWWEWTGVIKATPRSPVIAIGAVAIAGMAVSLAMDASAIALVCAVIGAGIAMAAARPGRAWAAAGVFYAAAVLVPVVLLRSDPALGLVAVLWLFAVVWAEDTAAYFTGRLVGGPRLAIRLSPNKTWAGTIGGLVAGVAAGSAVIAAAGMALRAPHVVIAFTVVVAAQLGDLFESAVKRRFGVKDASDLVPGHGGLMDRLDGFLVAACVALAIGLARAGADGPAAGLLEW